MKCQIFINYKVLDSGKRGVAIVSNKNYKLISLFKIHLGIN